MFAKLLIANRGEIACRIMRTAHRLGIGTVAIYSEADAAARHVALADEAYLVGPPPAAASYLDGARIIEVARRAGAEALHPGYGFLAENADFAAACEAAGLVFVGPPARAIRLMGSKRAAHQLMSEAGVPVAPGYRGSDQRLARLRREAGRIGYPVLIKPALGGGGKGIRRIDAAAEFDAAVRSARRESASAFGDRQLVVESYLGNCRHVEIQVFADRYGQVVHLFERDCSIQRRHQKIIEEAPAPSLSDKQRGLMGEAAVAVARAVDYVGAGTVEFMAEVGGGGAFYFMEMNTRLQVEHPVTEMVTGTDLVEWQLVVAAGEALPLGQHDLAITGHAIEARLYAEDAEREFLPSAGTLRDYRMPREGPHVRVDSGVGAGDIIGAHYDPMIAKLIVHDRDRPTAVRHLQAALAQVHIAGVATNLGFLTRLAHLRAFAAGRLDTNFLEHHRERLFPPPTPASGRELALAALEVLLAREANHAADTANSPDPRSPWHRLDAWRLNAEGREVLHFVDGEREVAVGVGYPRDGGYWLELPDGVVRARAEREGEGSVVADLGGVRLTATVVREDGALTITCQGASRRLRHHDPRAVAVHEAAAADTVRAPMPGKVIEVKGRAGARVASGATLLVIEAMKMEHAVVAPADGMVRRLHCRLGDIVEEGAVLVEFDAGGDS